MVEEVLVTFPYHGVWNLLERVDAAGLEITVAYWEFMEDIEEWRLVLASPLVLTKGPLFLIQAIQKILAEMPEAEKGDLELRDIRIINPLWNEVQAMRSHYGTVNGDREKITWRTAFRRREPFIYRLK